MVIKYILAVALVTPFLTVSSMAQQYQGGPKSSVVPTMRPIDIYAQGIDVYAPRGEIYAPGGEVYAPRGEVYAQGVRTSRSYAYPGRARTVAPYGR
jgi:hypothetical protein